VFFALPKLLRFSLIFALAFLPLSGGFRHQERKTESGSVMMGAPIPLLLDSAKTRASVAGVDRVTLYLPSLYANYLSYSYNVSPEKNYSAIFFPHDLFSQWQRWQL
jgi:hypothetical protein